MSARRARWLSALAAGVLLVVCVVRLDVKHPAGGFGHVVLAQELAAAMGTAVLVAAAALARAPLAKDRITALVGVLLALEVVSAAFAPNGWIALRASGLVLAGAATFLVARSVAHRRSGPSALFLVPLLVVAASVVLEATLVVRGLSRTGHAPGGLLGERNAAAELLVCGAPLVAWHAMGESTRTRVLALVTGAVSAAAIMCTRTRSAWLAALVLGLLGLGLALRGRDVDRRRGALFAGLVALALGIAPRLSALRWSSHSPFADTLAHLLDPASPSGHGRLVQYATTWRMALAHPGVGVGPGNWAGTYVSFAAAGDPTVGGGPWPTNRLPSSDVLGFLSERGIPAFGVAATLVLLLARGGPRVWLRRGTIVACVVLGSLDAVVQLAPHLLLVAWVLGSSMPQATHAASRARGREGALAAALALSAVLAVQRVRSFVIAVEPYGLEELEHATRLDPGDVALRLQAADDWITTERCDRAEPHLAAVRRYSPGTPMLRELEARCAKR